MYPLFEEFVCPLPRDCFINKVHFCALFLSSDVFKGIFVADAFYVFNLFFLYFYFFHVFVQFSSRNSSLSNSCLQMLSDCISDKQEMLNILNKTSILIN